MECSLFKRGETYLKLNLRTPLVRYLGKFNCILIKISWLKILLNVTHERMEGGV